MTDTADRTGQATGTATIEHESRLLIDGKLTASSTGARFAVVNPATGEVVAEASNASAEDMDRAIGAARSAFDSTTWREDHEFRAKCLRQLHEAIEADKEQLRLELVQEVGTPIALTYAPQLDAPLSDGLLWPADQIAEIPWQRRLPDQPAKPGNERWVLKESIGVVSAIIPWNFPFEILVNKLGPILATGNTVVVKAASLVPLNALRIGRLIAEHTDIPAGVVNVVATTDRSVSQMLVEDPRVDMVSFTGSTATGELFLKQSAPTFKKSLMELGGKSASIILDDADLETVLPMAAMLPLVHAGQGCALPTRLLVQRPLYDAVVAGLEQAFRQAPWGDPMDPQVVCGPVITAVQRDKIMSYVEKGKADGARLLVGGYVPEDRPGYWVAPTLFVDVDNRSTIAQEEIFGPVLCVTPFDTDQDAIDLANDSLYGLSGNVQTSDPQRALRIARGVRTGSFNVGQGDFYSADSPYGGYKHSGILRTGGIEGLEALLETKAVASSLPLGL